MLYRYLLKKIWYVKRLKQGGTFLLNTQTPAADIETLLPNKVKRQLAIKKANFYIINAVDLAYEIGLGRRINTIMQSAFFKLNEHLMDAEKANELMKSYAKKTYGRKGDAIVKLNEEAIDAGYKHIIKVDVKPEWATLTDEAEASTE